MDVAVPQKQASPPGDSQHKKHSKLRVVSAVLALSLGCFTFVSTELMPVGVLPSMAQGLGVSLGAAGYLITVFAFVVAITAAPLTGMLGGINRKLLMAGLLAVCCIGNLITFLAADYFIVLLARILVAGAIGVFWSTAVVTAVHLVSDRNAVRATSIVFGGVSLATVLGIPAGTLLGEAHGWHSVFAALSLLSLVAFTVIAWSVPAIRISKASARHAMGAIFKNGPLLALFATTVLVVTGNFLGYTYIAPYLEQIAHQSAGQVSLLLLVYGGAGVIANFAIGPFASKALKTSLLVVTGLLVASLAVLNFSAHHYATLVLALAVWGAAYGALPVLLQTSVFKGAAAIEGSADAATAINVALFNAAIGIGSLLGGIVINAVGPQPIPYVAAAFALGGLLVILASRKRNAR